MPRWQVQGSNARIALLLAGLCISGFSHAQNTGQTIRHHQVPVEDSPIAQQLAQAETALEKKDYAAAEPLLEKVVAADPGNYQAWFDLGFVDNALGKTQDSISAYRKSVAAKADVFESNLNLGVMLAKTGQPEAEPFLHAATVLKPTANADEGHARAWLSLAQLLENSKPEEAIEAYKQAATLEPHDPLPRVSAARLLEQENHFADAEQEYKQALGLDSNSTDALIGLANIYMRGQRYPEAAEVLHKLVALHPNDATTHLALARLLAKAGQNDDALAELQTAVKIAPGNADVQRDLADLYATTGKYDQAEAIYRSILVTRPNDADLHHALGVALLKHKQFPEAQQEFLNAVNLKPDLGAAYGDLAVAAVENKNFELAIKATDARAKYLPEIPISYFLRASAYDHLRDYKHAAENYRKFLETANGQYPDQEWQAKHRLITIEPKK